MRVAINARLLGSNTLRGWNRYSVNLIQKLPEFGVTPVLFTQNAIHLDHVEKWPKGKIEMHEAPRMSTMNFDQRWLPEQCRRYHVDLLHSTFNFGLPCRWTKSCPQLLTLHDAIDHVYHRDRLSWWKKTSISSIKTNWMFSSSRRSADRIITVSNHAKEDISRRFCIPQARIDVIHEAADDRFHRRWTEEESNELQLRLSLKRPYFFYVGGWEKRKNIPFLLQAFSESRLENVELVLAGGTEREKNELLAIGQSLGIIDSLKLLGWVDDKDLPGLYQNALAFVYPSEYEGFGLQICEAMAGNCPVFAADATSLPEVLGEGGAVFSLSEPTELGILLHRVATNPSFRDALVAKASSRDADFSWEKTTELTVRVYKSVI